MRIKNNKFTKNVLSGFAGQLIVIVLGIVIPRIMISSYGSDVNGILSTVAQIFSYLALLEAGIGQSARNALYKPIVEKDKEQISNVIATARVYFKKVTMYYAFGVGILSLVLPLLLKTDSSYCTVFMIIILEGMCGVVNFYYIQTPTILLNVDGKNYINNNINMVNRVLGYLVKILLAYLGVSIICVQVAFFMITIFKVLFYYRIVKKYYFWINDGEIDYSLLKDKNSYLLTEIAWTIYSSTDMIVLSVFISTNMSSVYSIYNMIFANIYLLLNSVSGSIIYLLGQTYHKSIDEYKIVHDSFTSVFVGAITILMSVCYVLCIPFIKIYTHDIADINYIYPQLPILFALVQLLSWSRYVAGNLTGLSGYAKQTSYISLTEAIINVVLSIIFVSKFGIVGVLYGTVLALPIKVFWCLYIADKKVLKRSYLKSFSIIGINYVFFFTVVFVFNHINIKVDSIVDFIIWGVILTCVFTMTNIIANSVVNKGYLCEIKKYVKRGKS